MSTGAMPGGTNQIIIGAPSKVVNEANFQTGAYASGSTLIPIDDTIPQITEGNEYMTLTYTPTNALNRLKIDIVFFVCNAGSQVWTIVALFQDATANALAAYANNDWIAGGPQPMTFSHHMIAGTTSPTTFRVRAGSHNGSAIYFNGTTANRLFGGVMASSITITEFLP